MYNVYKGDVEEDGQDPVVVRGMSAMWGTVLDALIEWQAAYWTSWAVGLVCPWTSCHHDTTGPW